MSLPFSVRRGVAAAIVWLACAAAAEARPLVLLAFGDSLTAGYGLPQESAFPVVLGRGLSDMGWSVTVRNGGVSGDTTAGGKARLDWMLTPKPDAVLLELGGNDALRALPPAEAEANLRAILVELRTRDIPVLFAGMMAPRNLGAAYAAEFDAVFPRLAAETKVRFYPFFLDGVAADPRYLQADGIHPNAAGVGIIVSRITPAVDALLRAAAARTPDADPAPGKPK